MTTILLTAILSTGGPVFADYVPDWIGRPVWQGLDPEPAGGPDMSDADVDRLPAWHEAYLGTDPNDPDTDDDLIMDGDEVWITGTNPTLPSTAGNGTSDYAAFIAASGYTGDMNANGIPDSHESELWGLYKTRAEMEALDTDGDGLSNWTELWAGGYPYFRVRVDGQWRVYSGFIALNPNNPDTDGDGISDFYELQAGTHLLPLAEDADRDGLPAFATDTNGQNPVAIDPDDTAPDTDGDGLPDGFEWLYIGKKEASTDTDYDNDTVPDFDDVVHGGSPHGGNVDEDYVSDTEEIYTFGTHPSRYDTDDDGLDDWVETLGPILLPNEFHPTNPASKDTDGDGLTDLEEHAAQWFFPLATAAGETFNPTLADTDGDGTPDWQEAAPDLVDSDGGGVPDAIERWYFMNPANAADDTGDIDSDGIDNVAEYLDGTQLDGGWWRHYDWDFDGMSNVYEIHQAARALSLPLAAAHPHDPRIYADSEQDPDGDGLLNHLEVLWRTDPYSADTDGDGLNDGEELTAGSHPLHWDTDDDGIDDYSEVHTYLTDPANADTDGDGMSDGLEIWNGLDPTIATGADGPSGDPDGDGLANLQELTLSFTNPHDADCDDDTLTDGEEFLMYGTSPLYWDSDFDLLSDAAEVNLHMTDPNDWDSDDDTLPDGWETDNSLDPNNATGDDGASGDPDGDLLANLTEHAYATDPHDADSDDDTLSDHFEVMVSFTNPNAADSDYDGLGDAVEWLVYYSNPWSNDSDGDTLGDAHEVNVLGTSPANMDTDGDWMWDDWELTHGFNPLSAADALQDADGDGLNNATEFLFRDDGHDPHVSDAAGFDWQADPDHDGLTNQQELQTHLTNPIQPDTDEDGLEDGWEIEYGMTALVNNNTDAITGNDSGDDPDFDGLNNETESQLGTNPFDEDTDADGVNDGAEEAQATNPKSAASQTPPPHGTLAVKVRIGDHSASHSEKFEVHLTPLEGDSYGQDRTRSNTTYGTVQTHNFTLPKGAKYNVTLIYKGTDPKYRDNPRPDYDYTLEFSTENPPADTALIIDDPQGMTGVHNEGDTFFAQGKSATLYTAHISSETLASVPTNTKRRKLGVGERVDISVVPSGLTATAYALAGNNSGNSLLTGQRLRAGYTACAPSVTTTVGGQTLQIDFNVVQPTMLTFEKVPGSDTNGTNPLSVDMRSFVYIGPDDVNFQAIVDARERGVNAVADGYFSNLDGSPHTPGTPLAVTTTWVSGKGWKLQGDDHIWGISTGAPYSVGTFTWSIPWSYRIGSDEGDVGTADHVMTMEIQNGKAKLKIVKKQQGAPASRQTESSITQP